MPCGYKSFDTVWLDTTCGCGYGEATNYRKDLTCREETRSNGWIWLP